MNPPDDYVPDRMLASGVDGLAVEHSHALGVSRLDDHRREPFDRLLVSQAILEDLQIISANPSIGAYEVEWIDATKQRARTSPPKQPGPVQRASRGPTRQHRHLSGCGQLR